MEGNTLFIIFILAVCLLIYGILGIRDPDNNGFKVGIPLIISAFIFLFLINFGIDLRIETNYDKVKEMAANGANVYLDGQKVDIDNISLEKYTIEFRENKVILSSN